MTASFNIDSHRFVNIGPATYNGLPRIFWQHWRVKQRTGELIILATKCIHPDADQEEITHSFLGSLCEY